MAELLVRVVDKINDDFYMNCGCTKRGDVIVVQENGWNWGIDELTVPFWAVVKLPDISVSAASALLAPEHPVDPLNPSKTLQRRAFKLDVDHPTISALIASDTRTLPDPDSIDTTPSGPGVSVATVGDLDLPSMTIAKPAIQDPAILGDSPNVIG